MPETRSTCTAEKLVQSEVPGQPGYAHSLHAHCDQKPGHHGLHEASDPFDPSHRIMWDGAGEMAATRVEPDEPADELTVASVLEEVKNEVARDSETITGVGLRGVLQTSTAILGLARRVRHQALEIERLERQRDEAVEAARLAQASLSDSDRERHAA